jgi:hypothetical protein
MVKDDGPCQPGDTKKCVYDAIQARLRGEVQDHLADAMTTLFPDGLPEYDSWRRTLERIEDHFSEQPEALAQLRLLGLCRRRRKAK